MNSTIVSQLATIPPCGWFHDYGVFPIRRNPFCRNPIRRNWSLGLGLGLAFRRIGTEPMITHDHCPLLSQFRLMVPVHAHLKADLLA